MAGRFPSFAPEEGQATAGFSADYFPDLRALEERHFWFIARNRLIGWAVRRHFGRARRVLEIGCGTGYVLGQLMRELPAARLTASEVLDAGLAHAAERFPSIEFIQMDARRIPYAGEFDLVGAFDVLEHIEDHAAVLAQVAQALQPGGGLLLTVPQHPWLWSAADDYARHCRRYTRRGLARLLEAAGFRIRTATSFVSLLLPLLVWSRQRNRNDPDFDPLAELRLPAALNRAFGAAMAVEHACIRAGLRFPAGGSLLVAAERVGPAT